MKIIDAHTHLRGKFFGCTPCTADTLRKEFIKEGLCGAWIMTIDGLFGNAKANNDILAETTQNNLDFFIPFCTVNPHDGQQQAIAELIRAKEKLGMRGLKLHPWLQAFSLTHPAVLPIIQKAAELNMPVLFHDGTPPYSTPLQIAAVAEKVPDATIILGHSGLDDLYEDAISACNRQANVYLCSCGLSSGRLNYVIEKCPTEKIIFGSDGGSGLEGIVEELINKVLATGVNYQKLQKIFYNNAKRILP